LSWEHKACNFKHSSSLWTILSLITASSP
jgi:hypothetical protein